MVDPTQQTSALSQGLGLGDPLMAEANAAMKAASPKSSTGLRTVAGKLQTEESGLTQKIAEKEQAAKTHFAEGEKNLAATEAAGAHTAADELSKVDKSYEAFAPSKENAASLASLFSLVNVAAFMAGGKGRYSGIAALKNMSGAMEGYKQGRKDVFDTEMKEFDKNFAVIKANADLAKRKYDMAIKLLSTDKEAGMAALKEVMAHDTNGIISMQGRQGDLKSMGASINKLVETVDKAAADKDKMAQEHANRLAEQKATQDHADKVQKRLFEHQNAIEKMKIDAAKIKQFDKTGLPMVQGIRSIENLQEQLRDPEIRQGLIAKASPLLEKISSLGDKVDFEQAVNSALTGTDKTTIFLKDALMASYEIERAATGGQRVTVQMMKQAGPVLDPTNYTAETYNGILEGRRKVLYNNLQDLGYTPEQIKAAAAPHSYEPNKGKPAASAKWTKEEFLAKARPLNPGVSDAELSAHYDKTYGSK